MTTTNDNLYEGREQTLVKHFILQHYLERFAHIIGSWKDVITYVDCFSGPWNVQSDDLKDSSFSLAVEQLRIARDTLATSGRSIRIRCMFLERDPDAYQKLKCFADGIGDVEVETRNSDFEDSVPDILAFIKKGGSNSFPFVFIDPTGWTGFAMDRIGPLLRITPGEVLINFMTSHIRRFIESPNDETQDSFERLFGSVGYRDRVVGSAQQDREDVIVQSYIESVTCVGSYKYVCPAIVLHPQINRTHFHLIYATRSPKGVEVFKQVEKKAMPMMEQTRAKAQQRKRVQKTGQSELFASDAMHNEDYYESLRDRYIRRTRDQVLQLLQTQRRILFDALWVTALSAPLVWESDLKDWISDWRKAGVVEVEGLGPRERVPKREASHWVVYCGRSSSTTPQPIPTK